MMKKKVKESGAAFLIGALAFSLLALPNSKAANAVDTSAGCAIGFAVSAEDFEELDEVSIPIHLYKVASIDVSGEYQAEAGFESVKFDSVEYDKEASAQIWEERAAQTANLIGEMAPTATVATNAGKAEITDLDTGLYLVMAEDTMAPDYKYTFRPYLISLPNNYYYTNGDDTWVYDLRNTPVGLKPEEEVRLGDLKITKNLLNQNVTSGEKATFVFQVDITTLKEEQKSKLVTLTFDTTGSKDAYVRDIPAGSSVVVTEIYSGASYELTSEASQTVRIVAEEEAGTAFSNTHNNVPNGGYGVDNNYKRDENGQYQWSQIESTEN